MYIAFLLLWIIFNGRVTLEILLIGIALCSALFLFCCRFLGYSVRKDIRLLKLTPLVAEYIVTLIAEILKANRQVLHYIVTPVYQVEPRIVHFKTDLKTESARVILANSITLTPGTITVGLEGADFYVHCLDSDFDTDLETSVFVKLLKRMEAVE
ncbi:MAG: Na+/H+ antiporter subunit E [Lachnospiraceae bacterium]|nr:Na+/H+ antiporter subunit E [Lachnospiraceae bacterium]MCD8249540.1 Na+/H+ antiporter subunit E [Lachnospiraceae bacterium]